MRQNIILKSSTNKRALCKCCMMIVLIGGILLFSQYALAASLRGVYAIPTQFRVNTKSSYNIVFMTGSVGVVKMIDVEFNNHFSIQFAKLISAYGIGSGSLSSSHDHSTAVIHYTVNSPVSVPEGTFIRLIISNITNSNIAGSYLVSISTKDALGNMIDGPTNSSTFLIS
jgi:hypothetical protein